jgi:hypothetical protein
LRQTPRLIFRRRKRRKEKKKRERERIEEGLKANFN